MTTEQHIILIGMPSAGKSTIGKILAERLSADFVDTDIIIQNQYGSRLEEIIRSKGIASFLDIEADICLSLFSSRQPMYNAENSVRKTVIATGGSVIYRPRAMEHLHTLGTIVYLRVPLHELQHRAGDLIKRGVTLADGQTMEDLYQERCPLYEKWAEIVVDESSLTIEETVNHVIAHLASSSRANRSDSITVMNTSSDTSSPSPLLTT